ncbi:MAG: hypothetical protein AUG90_00390 [Verrucomicrobia bacterium 13_1_20CM_4_55_9]|nr:MAG: hypothetical protein AUG90_00390 [Verrucomicrobia bacterium 13_1_20CM_4_55_9]
MTTAEFIIGHSADDAAERKKEARKILWALLAALGIHLLIGYSLAVFGGLLYSPFSVIEEDKPVELTFVDLATPAPAKNSTFIENDESKQTAEPKEKTFESNANSIAASELPASGAAPLPSQEGKDRPGIDFKTRDYVPPVQGVQPQPSVAEQSATPQPSAQPTPVSKSEEFAMLTSTPTPPPQAQPSSSTKHRPDYQRALTKVRISGNVANPGSSSVNASATALGRYTKLVWNLIVMRASTYFDSRGENSAYGSVDIEFVIEPNGRVRDVTVARNTSNQVFANIMLQAITDTPLPPIPQDILSTYPEGFEFDAGFDYIPDDSVTVHTR